MSTTIETTRTTSDLHERIQAILDARPQLEKTLRNYARDLGVSIDNVILGALVMVAQDYNQETGGSMIPRLKS